MKGYNGTTFIKRERITLVEGKSYNWSCQMHACIQAPSFKRLAEITNNSVNYCRNYWSPSLNAEMVEALSKHPPETLLVKGDYGILIDGQDGWVPV